LQLEKWGGYEVGDGVVELQLDDVRFIGIIVYIYDSKKRNKLSFLYKLASIAQLKCIENTCIKKYERL
jgi:hypothetical protein